MKLSEIVQRLITDAEHGGPAVSTLKGGLVLRMLVIRQAGRVCGYRVELERAWVRPGDTELHTLKVVLEEMGYQVTEECQVEQESGHLRRWWFDVGYPEKEQHGRRD